MNNNYRNSRSLSSLLGRIKIRRGLAWGLIIICALLAFEMFNFSTTEFALKDVLGSLNFVGIKWSTILAIAFCGIDFAGIARLFTPEQGKDEPAEVWYLFGAWLLAATMNAMLTWWGVSVAIIENSNLVGTQVVSATTMTNVVPVFIAIMVWLIRVLIIGTFSIAGDRLFSQADEKAHFRLSNPNLNPNHSTPMAIQPRQAQSSAPTYRSAPKPRTDSAYAKPEPSYHNISMSTQSNRDSAFVEPRN
jgi:hypothetical protein